MNKYYLVITLFFGQVSFAQKPVKLGERIVKPETVKGSSNQLFGLWKIFHKEYVVDVPRTYEIENLRDRDLNQYQKRSKKGNIVYGNYVLISDSLYYPYSSGMGEILVKPKYVSEMEHIRLEDQNHDPRLGNQDLLRVSLLCTLYKDPEAQVEKTFYFLTKDIVFSYNNNECTYLERVKDSHELSNTWKKNAEGYFYSDFVEMGDISLYIKKQRSKALEVILDSMGNKMNYYYCKSMANNSCNNGEGDFPWSKHKNYVVTRRVDIKSLKSDILKISGAVLEEDKFLKFRIKWRFIETDPQVTITTPKSFFYQDASESKPRKSFLLKGDTAFVEETKGDWLLLRYEGKTITRGWMHKKNVREVK